MEWHYTIFTCSSFHCLILHCIIYCVHDAYVHCITLTIYIDIIKSQLNLHRILRHYTDITFNCMEWHYIVFSCSTFHCLTLHCIIYCVHDAGVNYITLTIYIDMIS